MYIYILIHIYKCCIYIYIYIFNYLHVCMHVCMHDGGKDNTSNIISLPTLYIHNILLTLKHSGLATLPL